jgi:hypothetical protein
MISDLDIYRAANMLIERHADHALIEAARRADLMLERGDRDGQLVWLRIKRAIEAIFCRGSFRALSRTHSGGSANSSP